MSFSFIYFLLNWEIYYSAISISPEQDVKCTDNEWFVLVPAESVRPYTANPSAQPQLHCPCRVQRFLHIAQFQTLLEI
jgi:hypothetical protein